MGDKTKLQLSVRENLHFSNRNMVEVKGHNNKTCLIVV